mgnify:CR=1 FL=1
MSDKTKVNPDKAPYLTFIENKEPGLLSGDYQLNLTHELTGHGIDGENKTEKPITFHFSVLGDRFSIPPPQVHSYFPPQSSLGTDYHRVLPHIIFNRTTLPWERLVMEPDTAAKGNIQEDALRKIPWLALLVFQEDELDTKTDPGNSLSKDQIQQQKLNGRVVTLGSLQNSDKGWPGIADLEYASTDEKVTVIYAKKSVLADIVPTADEMRHLAHARQAEQKNAENDSYESVGNEMSIVISNRLPQTQGTSVIHLVSMENRYGADKSFRWDKAADSDLVTLVSLKSWQVTCITHKESFSELLHKLDRGTPILPTGDNINSNAKPFLTAGFLPHAHHFRRGGKSVSWYHGPLVPGLHNKGIDTSLFPIHHSDELLRYDNNHGMFDVSYAAAWELGRLLCLQQKKVSVKLYNWKRRHAQQIRQSEQRELTPHLPLSSNDHLDEKNIGLPPEVEQWFSDISLLNGVPFNYLLPDERLLPKESIRFFTIDSSWIASLLDGAFSIGRVIDSDKAVDQILAGKLGDTKAISTTISGFLIRSAAVSGYPGMLVEGYNIILDEENENQPIDTQPLKVLRNECIAPHIRLCLFEGELNTLDIHLKPEVLHFGLDQDSPQGSYYKKLRNSDGTERSEHDEIKIIVKMNDKRKVEVAKLFGDIQDQWTNQLEPSSTSITSAQFALEMIEGVPKVRFMNYKPVK